MNEQNLGLRIFSRALSVIGLALIFAGFYYQTWYAGFGVVVLFTSLIIFMPFVIQDDERARAEKTECTLRSITSARSAAERVHEERPRTGTVLG